MKSIRPFLLSGFASLLLLTGCATNPLTGHSKGIQEVGNTSNLLSFYRNVANTWGQDKPQQINITHVQFRMTMPNYIVMQKQAIGAVPIITNTDKREALLTSQAQLQVLDRGLRTKFEEKARQYNLTITPMSADVIHVDVKSIHSFCEAYKGCKTRVNIAVRVTNIENKEVWHYDGALEQPQPKIVVDDTLFDNFADTLLNAMHDAKIIGM